MPQRSHKSLEEVYYANERRYGGMAVFFSIVSAIMIAYPTWNWLTVAVSLVVSSLFFLGFLWLVLKVFIGKEGISNSAIGLFIFTCVSFCAIFIMIEGKILSIVHHW